MTRFQLWFNPLPSPQKTSRGLRPRLLLATPLPDATMIRLSRRHRVRKNNHNRLCCCSDSSSDVNNSAKLRSCQLQTVCMRRLTNTATLLLLPTGNTRKQWHPSVCPSVRSFLCLFLTSGFTDDDMLSCNGTNGQNRGRRYVFLEEVRQVALPCQSGVRQQLL